MHPAEALKKRTREFAVAIVKLCDELPPKVRRRMRDQLCASGTAIGANYRAACRAKSHDDFISKIATVAEEADETVYWLDLLVTADLVDEESIRWHRQEAGELLAIMAASHRTAVARRKKKLEEKRGKTAAPDAAVKSATP